MVTCLVDNGAEKDIRNRLGKTPISRAFRYSHDSIVEYFKTLGLTVPVVSLKLTLPGQNSGIQKCIQPHPRVYGAETATDYITNNAIVEVYDETIAGSYKLVDGRGYTLVANKGCVWTPTTPILPPFTMGSLPPLQSGATQSSHSSGTSIRVRLGTMFSHRIRPDPSLTNPEVGFLDNGAIIEVDSTTINGFYRLIDGRGYALASGPGFTWTKLWTKP